MGATAACIADSVSAGSFSESSAGCFSGKFVRTAQSILF
jgi:hypothetical protein